jgi:hypothetical protein
LSPFYVATSTLLAMVSVPEAVATLRKVAMVVEEEEVARAR